MNLVKSMIIMSVCLFVSMVYHTVQFACKILNKLGFERVGICTYSQQECSVRLNVD